MDHMQYKDTVDSGDMHVTKLISGNRMYVKIGKISVLALVDSGASINVINSEMLSNLPLTVQQKQYNISSISVDLANNDTVNITSCIIIDCNINDRHYSTLCHVLPGAKHKLILGLPFMYMVGAILIMDVIRLDY